MQYTTNTRFTTTKQKIKDLEDNYREIIKFQENPKYEEETTKELEHNRVYIPEQ